jgi:DNA mismatch repair ATPase MutS
MEQEITARYEALAQQYQQELEKKKLQLRIISWLRLAFFLSIIPVFIYLMPVSHLFGWVAVFACFSTFLWLVIRSVNTEKQLKYYQNLFEINTNEIRGIHRDFSQFDPGKEFIHPDHDYSYDLDLFGENSFFQFLNRTVTSGGKNRLAGSVQKSSQDAETIRQKQLAIDELAECLDWRQQFLASGQNTENSISVENVFHQKQSILLKNTSLLKFILAGIPIITLFLGALYIFDLIPFYIFFLAIFSQWILSLTNSQTIGHIIKVFGLRTKLIKQYSDMLLYIENKEFKSGYLILQKSKLYHQGKTASQITSSLQKILNEFDYRQNIIIGIVLNSIFLWDIRCIYRLHNWQKKYGGHLKEWLDVIAEMDSLISFANLNYNHPEWVVPVINPGGFMVQAENLGHPLIAKEKRIDNHFDLNNNEQIVIITGANMAGKSTFLRTVGINLILASQGCKVCATSFGFSPVRLFTNMRTTDNLMKDESYFYAELLRLKCMLELLRNGENLFIIIDEMLKGTNSIDKLNGSVELLKQLIQLKTHCMVATHDLKLTELADRFPGTIKNQCFEVNLTGDELKFDYKLKEGVTSTMNATFLMKKMGIIQ